MRGALIVKTNLFVGFGIEPVAARKASTGKRDRMRAFAVDNSELQIAAERCSIYKLPFHDG